MVLNVLENPGLRRCESRKINPHIKFHPPKSQGSRARSAASLFPRSYPPENARKLGTWEAGDMYRFSRSGTCPRSFPPALVRLHVPSFASGTCSPLHPSSSGACPPPCPHLPYQKCGAESFRHNSAGRCQESAPCRTIKRIRKGTRTGGTCPHLEAGAWTGVNNPRSGPRWGHVPLLSKRYVSPFFSCPRSFRVPGLFVSPVFISLRFSAGSFRLRAALPNSHAL